LPLLFLFPFDRLEVRDWAIDLLESGLDFLLVKPEIAGRLSSLRFPFSPAGQSFCCLLHFPCSRTFPFPVQGVRGVGYFLASSGTVCLLLVMVVCRDPLSAGKGVSFFFSLKIFPKLSL